MISSSIIKAWFRKNQSALMLGAGITGMVTTTVLAVRGHSKAKDTITEELNATESNDERSVIVKFDKKDRMHYRKWHWIKKTWKYYIPATITGSLSIGCLISSYNINQRRNAALASSLALSEAAMKEYQKHVVETIGEEAEKGIRDKFQASQVAKVHDLALTENQDGKYMDGDGSVNCYESTTQQKFWASKEDIRRAVNNLNQERLTSFLGEVCLNDLYEEFGMQHTTLGDVIGWRIDNPVEVDISAIEVKGIPCLYVKPENWVYLS